MNRTPNWTFAVAALAALCAVLLAATLPAWAQDDGAAAAAAAEAAAPVADPPARVGRVSALVGAADLSRDGGRAWEPAQVNQPVTGLTALATPAGGHAEVRIGSASVRLHGDTQALFERLDDRSIVIDVAQGTVRARVRHLPPGDAFSFVADGLRAEAQSPGDYRFDHDAERGLHTLRALAGELRVVTPNNVFTLQSGQETVLEDGGDSIEVHAVGERDDFDAWAEARDGQQDALASARYVSPETTGIEALDEHGRWEVTDDYGAVWYPRALPEGWAPYRHGRWTHVEPWGWTWVDDAPWGFAPFHYGRWALIGSHWAWVPGPVVTQPVWAPALVGYVGGSNWSVAIGPSVGWFPLGPFETYHPPFRYSPRYWDHVNWHRHRDGKHRHGDWRHRDRGRHDGDRRMTHQPTPGYRYARESGALTVVSAEHFQRSRSVAERRVRLDAGQIAQLAPYSPGLRLPTVTPDLRGNGSATGVRPPPVLRLPNPPRRDFAEGRPREAGDRVFQGERRGEPGRDGWRRSPRERDANANSDGDRRMVVRPRPPALGGEDRFRTWERVDGRPSREGRVDRGDRIDRSDRINRGDRGDRSNRAGGRQTSVQPVPSQALTPIRPMNTVPAARDVPPGRPTLAAPPMTAQPPLTPPRPSPRGAADTVQPRGDPRAVGRPAPERRMVPSPSARGLERRAVTPSQRPSPVRASPGPRGGGDMRARGGGGSRGGAGPRGVSR